MPSTSKKQHNLMAAVAKNPAFAKKVGIKQSVGEEFLQADKGKKFGVGGGVNQTEGGKGMVNRQQTRMGSIYGHKKEVPNVSLNKYVGLKGGGMATNKLKSLFKGKESMKEELAEAKAIKSGKISPMEYAKGEKMEGHKKGGSIKEAAIGSAKMGAVKTSPSRDGIAQRGRTKGRNV